jgi:sulfate adenylyltransferase
VYDESQNEYISPEDAKAVSKIVSISGTEFRRRLREGEEIPEWFSFPEVIEELGKK